MPVLEVEFRPHALFRLRGESTSPRRGSAAQSNSRSGLNFETIASTALNYPCVPIPTYIFHGRRVARAKVGGEK